MQRRKPMTAKHQARRRNALERLEARISRQKDGPDAKQLAEIASLKKTLNFSEAAA